MAEVIKPETGDQVLDAVKWAVAEQAPLEIVGRGSKRALGRPLQVDHSLDVSALAGISLYEPEELVLSAGPGTPLAEIGEAVAAKNQMLAFEPPDWGPLLGGEAGQTTLGGLVSTNLAGPRRIKYGAVRDHVLGLHAVSGRGEVFKTGGRVVKNVTGYDLSKLMTGAYGTLGVLTDLTLKVLPAPETERTVLVFGLDPERALAVMTVALKSPHDISGAAHLPGPLADRTRAGHETEGGVAVTALRLEGFGPSVNARSEALHALLELDAPVREIDDGESRAVWADIRDVAPFVPGAGQGTGQGAGQGVDALPAVWRISVAPTDGPGVAAAIASATGAETFFDWGGGLVWAAVPAGVADAGADVVRGAVAASQGGHATLIRAPAPVRAAIDVFQPQPAPLAALSRRVKESFDPNGVLNPGRMVAGV
jgi:glycolate oxidase FAD binding subunit